MREELEQAAARNVSREIWATLQTYVELLTIANAKQNLVAASTLARVWERHILDSAQLVRLEPRPGASWVDIGSGAGLPGLVIAVLVEGPVVLIEPRRLRAQFLKETTAALGLNGRVNVLSAKAENVRGAFDVVTARAVASLDRLLAITHQLSHPDTLWVLPKGRSAKLELAEAQRNWQCDIREEPSRTDRDSTILVLSGVRARRSR